MKKILATSLVFFGLCGCASITGSTDYGQRLSEKDVLIFSYNTSSYKDSYISLLANEIYDAYNFEQDVFAGDLPEDIKHTLQIELVKYLENQDALLLRQQGEKGIEYTRYVKQREGFDARKYDPVKKAYLLRASERYHLPTLEFKNRDRKALTSNWPLRTIVNQEMLYEIVGADIKFSNIKYDWNVKPSQASEYSYKANRAGGSIEYIRKLIHFAGEPTHMRKDYKQVDLLNQINDMSCVYSKGEFYTQPFKIKCEATNNIVRGYIATDM